MFVKEWEILLVDDEPDILSLSKLAMKNMDVDGVPLRLHTAQSKAEAIQKIDSELTLEGGFTSLAVAFIDVVMESDTAGLELCQYIREKLGYYTQLYIRTGQPGIAPERSVIDRYEINGYFTKIEMTEDKLYSLIKSGVRQFDYMSSSVVLSSVLGALIEARESREVMSYILNQFIAGLESSAAGELKDTLSVEASVSEGNNLIAGKDNSKVTWQHLHSQPGLAMHEAGDKIVINGNQLLIAVPETDSTAGISLTVDGYSAPPLAQMPMFWSFMRSIASLWKYAN
jgi:CheY-like chemotaxis protein